MKGILPEMIKSALDLQHVVINLETEERTSLCKDIVPLDLIKSVDDYIILLHTLPTELRTSLPASIIVKLSSKIKTAKIFNHLMTDRFYLVSEQEALRDNIMPYLPDMIQSVDDYCKVMEVLSVEQRTSLCNSMKEKLPGMINVQWDDAGTLPP